jgi:DNA polymerase epsilon subunit 1
VGGHVESLESGVFRSDLPCKFNVDPKSYQMLIDNIDRALTFSVEVEYGIERSEIANYDEVRSEIVHQLELIRDRPVRDEIPFIYHLDVAAMYPNIILTNRLQPSAIVDASTCAACDYNRPGANCRRKMPWTWRGDMFPAKRSEYEALKTQLEYESVDGVPFHKLPYPERNAAVRARLKTYSQTVYKKTKKTEEEVREAVVCQRENSFYVNTVRSFRDRRYDYKGLKKKWSRAAKAAKRVNDVVAAEEARNKTLLYVFFCESFLCVFTYKHTCTHTHKHTGTTPSNSHINVF